MTQQLSFTLIFDCERKLANFSFFDIGQKRSYLQVDETKHLEKWYRDGVQNQLSAVLKSDMYTSLYFSGPFVELLMACDEEMIKAIKRSVQSGYIELLGGTYHHSLSSVYSQSHFDREVIWHQKIIKKVFGFEPKTFFNTENVYFNDLSKQLKNLGYYATFTGAVDWYLGDNKSQRIFSSRVNKDFKILLISSDHQTLFQDQTITNHFLQMSVNQLIEYGGWSKIIKMTESKTSIVSLHTQIESSSSESVYHVRLPISGPYRQLGLEHLNGHPLQKSWLNQIYKLTPQLKDQPQALQKIWSSLTSVSHLTKLNPDLDGSDEHSYYDAYRTLSNIINDLELKL